MNITVSIIFIVYVFIILTLRYFTINERYRYVIRKSVHFATGLVIFFLTFHVERMTILILIFIGTVFAFSTFKIKKFNYIHKTSGSSLGTLFYPSGLLLSFTLLYNMPVYYFRLALMILSISDTIANLCGEIKSGNIRFIVFKETKSVFGVAGFAVSAFLLHMFFLPGSGAGLYPYILLSVVAAVNFEIISFRGSDNFTIPVGCSLFFILSDYAAPNLFFTVIILSIAAGAFLLYKKNILTRYGSIAAYFLGVYFLALPGKAWIIPVVTFFLTSVLFTGINGFVNSKSSDTNRRNVWQVFANIFFAIVSSAGYLITGDSLFIYFYITLIATVTADTWASEIGPILSKRCFSISNLKFMDSGISGGISLPGTLAAAGGSLLISIFSYYLFFQRFDASMICIISLSGFAAVFVDSLLSAFLEPELLEMDFFKSRNGSDSPSPNDIVNLSASLTAPAFFLLLNMLI